MTSSTNNKPDKKLSIYLSGERLALLSGHASGKGISLAQGLYGLIDALAEPTIEAAATQADIRQLQEAVHESISSTKKLAATIALAMGHEHEEPCALDVWLHEALGSSSATKVGALIVPTRTSAAGVHFTTRTLKLGEQLVPVPMTELVLSREAVGPVLWHLAKTSDTAEHLAFQGQRAEGTHWLFRIVRKDAYGKPSMDIATFKHPSRESQEAS